MKPLYSIIIPHYNDTKRLQRLLHSIPLERPDIQVLVIDDCSPDQEMLAVLKGKTPNIEWYSTEKNSGAGRARNIGLKHAKGKFLVFADSDDEFTENAFEIMDQAADDEVELCYFLAEAVQEVDLTPSNRANSYNNLCMQYLNNPNTENLTVLKGGHVIPVAKMYDRKFISNAALKFDETRIADDIAFNVLAAFEANKINVIPKPTYRIYRRKGSLTTKIDAEAFLTQLNVSANLSTRLKERGIPYRRSATGALVRSARYGPLVFLKTLKIILTSDLEFNIFRLFNIKRWYRYFSKNLHVKKELDKLDKP